LRLLLLVLRLLLRGCWSSCCCSREATSSFVDAPLLSGRCAATAARVLARCVVVRPDVGVGLVTTLPCPSRARKP
jgi:hypothetical protein